MRIVDARTGKLVKVGETVKHPPTEMLDGTKLRSGFKLEAFTSGLFNGRACVRVFDGERETVSTIKVPIKWFPRFLYGPQFPTDALRVAILPS